MYPSSIFCSLLHNDSSSFSLSPWPHSEGFDPVVGRTIVVEQAVSAVAAAALAMRGFKSLLNSPLPVHR